MECVVCKNEIARGKRFIGSKYKSLHFCSQDCFERYAKMKSAPKPPVNFKPQHGSDRRKFTDYIQEWTGDKVNWQWIMKQAKDIEEQYELDWKTMYQVLKYCKEYEMLDWNMEYGLYQFFPKYIKPMKDFTEVILKFKNEEYLEDEIYIVPKRKYDIGKVEF